MEQEVTKEKDRKEKKKERTAHAYDLNGRQQKPLLEVLRHA